MKWVSVLGITLLVTAITLLEWPKFSHLSKEKMAFAALFMIGYVLAILLIFYPELPGPTQMATAIYKPFAKILER
ncbi:hypothetical protein [Paenibacillus sp. LjRoot56]|uniref:hypothetical protein n=1 Tax=Paenibacillus sp. LjRoot56 TaxID=3342333 RepID=UPI003ED1578E